ncbi:hypothetical protein O7606_20455 [Micromonospora sp. WMMD882]|uniref:hypothetical protein n=1 Tax=Micromonospora sp. WMMD882 TaxID=3015151 RepID=UPI00248C7815|nr:hypothetical protein [Micromonospora sp. WMMD882]WBB78575.1 hypothetical protein O7606_20455 [Micromonospora sp. WMMD882]
MPDQNNPAPDRDSGPESHAVAAGDHLAAAHIMIGDVGVFAGDWGAYEHHGRNRHRTGFVGRLDAQRGRDGRHAVFSCDRDVAEEIVAEQERLRDEIRQRLRAAGLRGPDLDAELDLAYAPLRFDGDDVVLDERGVHGDAEGLSRICPDAEGRYAIRGQRGRWEWQAVDPADCDRVAGTPPTASAQPARVPLRHSRLHVPHRRLSVTSLTDSATHDGVFTATLCLDGTPVGVIDNYLDEGKTRLRHHDPTRFSEGDLREFVAGCRFRREPTDTETVLDRLVAEHELDTQIATLPANGILARTVDADGDFCGAVAALESLTGLDQFDQPATWAGLAVYLMTFDTSSCCAGWQVWLGDTWRPVPALITIA